MNDGCGHNNNRHYDRYHGKKNDDDSSSIITSSKDGYTMTMKTSDFTDNNEIDGRNLSVTKISDTACSLTTSLQTEYEGWEVSSTGIMFTVQPISEQIELLTIEFQATSAGIGTATVSEKVQVYYRMGSFSGVIDDPSQWILLSDTYAHLITTSGTKNVGAVVPINEFKSVSFSAGEVYSIYISLPSSLSSSSASSSFIKIKPSDRLVGEISAENDTIEIQTGVSLDEKTPFPTSFKEAADFNGILHYQVIQLCEDIMSITATTPVLLNFAVNDEPTDEVTTALSDAVVEAISELFISNENLASYAKYYGLKIEGVKSGFQGSIEEKCPKAYSKCSLISTTVWFIYIQSMVPNFGVIEIEIFNQGEQINDLVSSYMAPIAETQYIGTSLSKGEFIITLIGTRSRGETTMNDIQKRYFEDVTLNFLREIFSGSLASLPIFTVTVINDIPETIVEVDEVRKLFFSSSFSQHDSFVAQKTARKRKSLRQRKLQLKDDAITSTTIGTTQIITEIAAESTMQELRTLVLEGIGNNQELYINDLITQQMRPGEINEQNYGAFFSDLTGSSVKLNSVSSSDGDTSGGENGGKPGENGNGTQSSDDDAGGGGSLWVIVCILLIVVSLLWILYRVYMDCFHSSDETPPTLKDDKEEKKKEPTTKQRIKIPKFGRKQLSRLGRLSDTDVTPPQKEDSDQDDFDDEIEPFVQRINSGNNSLLKSQPQSEVKNDMLAKSRPLHDTTITRPVTKLDVPLSSKSDHPKKEKLVSMKRIFPFMKKKSNGNERGIKSRETIPDTSKDRSQKRGHSFCNEDDGDSDSESESESESESDSDSDSESCSTEEKEYKEEKNIESISIYTSDEEEFNSKSNSSKGSDSDSDSSNEEDNRRYRLVAKQKTQKRGPSFHNEDDGDSDSDLESCSTKEEEYKEENNIECISIYTSDEEEFNSESNSSKGSDSDSDSSNKEDNRRYRLVAKQKVRIPIHQIPKQNKNPESKKYTPKKVKKHVLLQKKSLKSVVSSNVKNRYVLDEDLSVATKSAHALLSDDISKKPHELPPLDASNAMKRGISTSKCLSLQSTRSTTTSTTKKKKIGSKSAHDIQSDKTSEAVDEGKMKKKKNITADCNHKIASKTKETKKPSSDKTGFHSQNKTKKRGIKATKSMHVRKKKATRKTNTKTKKVVAMIALDSDLSSSLSGDSEFVVDTIDNSSEISSLSKTEKKRGKKEKKFKSNLNSTSKTPKDRFSDKTGLKNDQFGTRRRGIRLSKSMPIRKERQKKKSSVVLWSDMVHDSESDSDDDSIFVLETTAMDDASGVSSLSTSGHDRKTVPTSQEEDIFQHSKEEEENRRRSSSRKKDTSKKRREVGNWYGKVGKIKFETKRDEKNGFSWQPTDGYRAPSKLEDILM